eukprot:Gregarina_sp_Poly_1__1324@NODE_1327_length_4372_cov_114_816725_g8_i2_p1_GENE_NODE_1327_length_4372_cov_114_816725_g8_i2NODE_1327_length_4372_cov_114_816725_g8_i2_p1_ORF_typecomplete_len771_score100_07_NODE_1327_length_4372_cov_114_816725_g8_i220594176
MARQIASGEVLPEETEAAEIEGVRNVSHDVAQVDKVIPAAYTMPVTTELIVSSNLGNLQITEAETRNISQPEEGPRTVDLETRIAGRQGPMPTDSITSLPADADAVRADSYSQTTGLERRSIQMQQETRSPTPILDTYPTTHTVEPQVYASEYGAQNTLAIAQKRRSMDPPLVAMQWSHNQQWANIESTKMNQLAYNPSAASLVTHRSYLPMFSQSSITQVPTSQVQARGSVSRPSLLQSTPAQNHHGIEYYQQSIVHNDHGLQATSHGNVESRTLYPTSVTTVHQQQQSAPQTFCSQRKKISPVASQETRNHDLGFSLASRQYPAQYQHIESGQQIRHEGIHANISLLTEPISQVKYASIQYQKPIQLGTVHSARERESARERISIMGSRSEQPHPPNSFLYRQEPSRALLESGTRYAPVNTIPGTSGISRVSLHNPPRTTTTTQSHLESGADLKSGYIASRSDQPLPAGTEPETAPTTSLFQQFAMRSRKAPVQSAATGKNPLVTSIDKPQHPSPMYPVSLSPRIDKASRSLWNAPSSNFASGSLRPFAMARQASLSMPSRLGDTKSFAVSAPATARPLAKGSSPRSLRPNVVRHATENVSHAPRLSVELGAPQTMRNSLGASTFQSPRYSSRWTSAAAASMLQRPQPVAAPNVFSRVSRTSSSAVDKSRTGAGSRRARSHSKKRSNSTFGRKKEGSSCNCRC